MSDPVLPDWMDRRSRPVGTLVVPDGPASAGTVLAGLARSGALGDWGLLVGWTPGPAGWVSALGPPAATVLGGYGLTGAISSGQVRYLPIRLSRLGKYLRSQARPDVVVVRARPGPDGLVHGPSVGWGPDAVRLARRVVVEVDDTLPALDAPLLGVTPDAVVDSGIPAHVPAPARPDAVDLRIGALVAGLLPRRPTLQWGPGVMAEAVLAAVDDPVAVWSGLVSDGLIRLVDRGLLLGRATAAYLWGGDTLHRLAADGAVRLTGVDETHDPARLAATQRLVALNTALQVGLDGSVNIERVGGRTVAGVGGHADFAAGAASSPGGLSIIALRASRHGRSAIVARPETVSTAGTDIDVVVTEHGIADLRGLDAARRARALVGVADPEHRDGLEAARRGVSDD